MVKPNTSNNIVLHTNPCDFFVRSGLKYILINVTTFYVEAKGRLKSIENKYWMGVLDVI